LSNEAGYCRKPVNAEQAIGRLRDVVRRQHKAISTESTYVFWLRRYMLAIPRYPEEFTSEHKLERFLTELARDRGISAVSQNQAFNAILFLYRDVLGHLDKSYSAGRATAPPTPPRHQPTPRPCLAAPEPRPVLADRRSVARRSRQRPADWIEVPFSRCGCEYLFRPKRTGHDSKTAQKRASLPSSAPCARESWWSGWDRCWKKSERRVRRVRLRRHHPHGLPIAPGSASN